MALHPINDRTFLYSAAANQIGETNLYSIVKSVLGVTGSLSIIDDPTTGKLTLSNGSGAALSATTPLSTGSGVKGGGLLSSGLTIEMDITSLTIEAAPAVGDYIPFYDLSAGVERRTQIANLPFLTTTGGTLTGPLEFSDGSVAAPSFTWSSDPTSGMFWNGAGFELVVGGTSVATIDAAGLTVNGTMTTVNTNDLIVSDNTITLNDGEAGAGVTAGSAGISVDRGTDPNANVLWDEVGDRWRVGPAGSESNVITDASLVPGDGLTGTIAATTNTLDVDINGLPALVAVDKTNDEIMLWDVSAGALVKAALSDVLPATGTPAGTIDVVFPLTALARRVWQNLHTETITPANAGLWSLSGYGNVDTVNDDNAFRIQVNGVDVARNTGGDYGHGSDPNGGSSASVVAITLAAGDVVTFDFIHNGNATDGVTGRASGVLH